MLGRLGEALQRQHGGARDQPSEQRRERDAADVEQREDQAQAAEQAVDFGERLRELDGAPGAERLGEDPQVRAVDVGVGEERRAAVGASRGCAASTGSEMPRAERTMIVPVRAHHLLVAAHLVGFGREVAEGVVAPAPSASRRRARRLGPRPPAWPVAPVPRASPNGARWRAVR